MTMVADVQIQERSKFREEKQNKTAQQNIFKSKSNNPHQSFSLTSFFF